MFAIEKSTRPDRCELCRHSICVQVYASVPTNSLVSPPYGGRPPEMIDRRVCKRFPPTAGDVGYGGSPFVGDGNWCGEFAQRGSQES